MLVGREQERGLLEQLLEQRTPALVVGEPGIGKTTLLRAAAAATCLPTFEGGAFATLSWLPLLAFERALGRPLADGDAHFVAREVEREVGGGILILDDVQWAAPATLEVLELLGGRVAVAAAVRRGDPGGAAARGRLSAFRAVELDPLPADAAAELVRAGGPRLGRAAVSRIVERAGGNPLLLQELAAGGEPSESLKLALAARARQLTPAGQHALRLLALLGRPAPVELLGSASAELVEAGLAAGDGVVAIRHALVAETIAESLTPTERSEAHAELAGRLPDPGEAARHYLLGDRRAEALERARVAAAAARTPGERAEHLRIAAASTTGPEAGELRLAAARALLDALDAPAAEQLVEELDPPTPEGRAERAYVRAMALVERGRSDAARSEIERGLAEARASGSPLEVRLQVAAATVAIFNDNDFARGRPLAEEAVRLARRHGRDEARALGMLAVALTGGPTASPSQARALFLEAAERARAEGDASVEIKAVYNSFLCGAPEALDYGRMRAEAGELLARTRELRLGFFEGQVLAYLGRIEYLDGDFAAARDRLEGLLLEPLNAHALWIARRWLTLTLVQLGSLAEAAAQIQAIASGPASRALTPILARALTAELELAAGRPREALAAVRDVLGPLNPTQNTGWEPFATLTGAWAALVLGEPAPEPGDWVTPDDPETRSATEEIAAVALLARDDPAAPAAFAQARALWAACNRAGELRCVWAEGEARRRAGDDAAARLLLEAAEVEAEARGMQPLLARVHRSLRLLGARRSARGAADERGLTAREREILALVGDGLTNAEIGRRLGISAKAVAHAVAAASGKLGAENRAHAASLALRP